LDDGATLIDESVSHTAATVVMPQNKKSKLPVIFVSILALLVLGIVTAWFIIQRNYGTSQRASGNTPSAPVSNQPATNTVPATSSPALTDAPQAQAADAIPIATKDLGSLRVVLKSVLPLKLQNGRGGVRCAFDFTNLETQKPIVVAMNANAYEHAGNQLGYYLRSTLVDENGGIWRLSNTDVTGMSIVGVGQQHATGVRFNPAEIAAVLSKRDELKSDVLQESGIEYRFVFGSTTEMSPGQTLSVTVNFAQDVNPNTSGAPAKVFQMAAEIVVGLVTANAKTSYSLHNLTFDRVRLP
jgi:hypothetical protein